MTSAELFEAIKAAEIPYASHESDLYIKRTEESVTILQRYQFRENVRSFKNNIDGLPWFDVPFAYQPFWDKVQERSNRQKEALAGV